MEQFCFGVDVGGTSVKIGLFNDQEIPIHTWEIPTRKEEKGKYILSDIRDAMSAEMIGRGITPDQILGVGIGIPGPVMENGVVNGCVNLGWDEVDVSRELSGLFYHLPVRAGNDANVAALGEAWFGGAKGYRNMAMLTLGTGLGCGIVLNGRILAGAHGSAGEYGHAPLYPYAKKPCNCGRTGCLEQIASATGILNRAKELLAERDDPSVLREKSEITAKDVMDACKAGDPIAVETIELMTDCLARGMAVLAVTVDPEVFVIGGGVSRTGQWLMDKLKEKFDGCAFHACRRIGVVAATLGNDAGMFGAAAMILSER